jgi:hypothetical protein
MRRAELPVVTAMVVAGPGSSVLLRSSVLAMSRDRLTPVLLAS